MGDHEVSEREHLLDIYVQRGFTLHARNDRLCAAERPARENLERGPAQLVEAVRSRIMQRPGGRPIRVGRRGRKAQLLA